MEASVSKIHRHPLRPAGFEEPLFLGPGDKKEIAEHLRQSAAWLRRAGEIREGGLEGTGEVCHVLARPDGSAHLVRGFARRPGCRRRRRRASRSRVERVIERWREVRGWWTPGRGSDRLCFRVQLAGGSVLDLALDHAGSWTLLRVLD
ncbi:hypothetical protein GBA63_22335 (plasmid) [Rubrobacter tropicus]|uniref:Uncharacterized protein n=1 Tax=Rubrobacter tropicus TaxID=2653851 RepID=A0A6G8QG62_9ACTN|nr:hypothetical protein [Rubrobacter tropicus]QIN85442.1 hypothetical protein GBA63_22335 [Rubrobacter tropicus]